MEEMNVETPIDMPIAFIPLAMPGIAAITVPVMRPVSVVATTAIPTTAVAVMAPAAVMSVVVASVAATVTIPLIITSAVTVMTMSSAILVVAGIVVGYKDMQM